ncbi:TIGR02270 family protein [Melittangium boletus]|uniref:TIGR02270 family protein n=1 Tax=Melittangium boletus DSM 14713 TaxID=1294270 RepID=A0A250IQS2_9BACT|nr:TIGR02270 family protein [Melittangium boletus]ATB34084.1 hypothetical protein MEBOL_007585 [Melittangium boletus DSM 14713]
MHIRADIILNWSNYEEHLDEAAFFWGQWERAFAAPDEVLHDVAESEERLLARLDALVLGGEYVAERLLKPALASDEPERLSAAVFALLSGGWRWGPDAVLGILGEASPAMVNSIRRALELLDPRALPAWPQSLLAEGTLPLRALALEVLGAHAITPSIPLKEFVLNGEPSVAAAALRAAARLQVRLDWHVLQRALSSPEPAVRDAALVAGLLSGHRETWTVCRLLVSARGPDLGLPLLLLSLGAGPGGASLLRSLLDEPRCRPDVLWALGFSGYVSAAETCLEHLDTEAGHLAAEAFSAITGLVLAGRFVAEAPDAFTEDEELNEEPSGPGQHPAPGNGMPLPNVNAIHAWWTDARKQFDPAVRYLRGSPWTPASLLQGLWTEPMRRRHALALEVTLRSQGIFQLRTRTFARHQLAAMEAIRAAPPALLSRPLAERPIS